MQVTMTDALPQSRESSPSYRIWSETEGGLEEKMTANFIDAFKNYWKDYLPKARPSFPSGFENDHSNYLAMNDLSKRSEAWKAIQAKYAGYFKALYEVESENRSNLYFLEEARAHFEKMGMADYSGKVRAMIGHYGMTRA